MNKQMGYIRHYVMSLDDTGIQRCIFCGEIISDYRGMMAPAESPPSKGYAEGHVYVRPGQPKITMIFEPDEFQACGKKV